MMSDRELLTLAARAINLEEGWQHIYSDWDGPSGDAFDWNPLDNNDDAFRLLVDSSLIVQVNSNSVNAGKYFPLVYTELSGSNKYKAARRAIVYAAAEIGRNMK